MPPGKPSQKPRIPSVTLINRQVKKYASVEKHYIKYAVKLEAILKKAADQFAPLAVVQSRAKSIVSFAGKIPRKWEELESNDPVTEFTDLCGARIIALTKSHSDAICKFIEENFDVDRKNSLNARDRLRTAEFGYLSRHYIVSFRKGHFPTREIDVKIPRTLLPSAGCPMKAEIQVRTILEHAYAEITHDLCYKSSFKVPDRWMREVAAVAAALETTSNELEDIVAGIQDYAANYGGTLSTEETRHEIEKLSVILRFDKDNAELAGRIARLAITIGEWHTATKALQKFVDAKVPGACRDYGIALVKQYRHSTDREAETFYEKGQELLKMAAESEPADSEAMAEYASSWRKHSTETVKNSALTPKQKKAGGYIYEWYHKAYTADPKNTYALSNVIELEISRRKDLSVISLMRPSIKDALKHCLDQAEVGTNHPWAFYNAALFSILLGNQEKGLGLLAKAIACSNAPFMLESACRTATRIIAALGSHEGMEMMQQLLATGNVSKGFSCSSSSMKKSTCASIAESSKRPFQRFQGQIAVIAGDCGTDAYESVQKYRPVILEAFREYKGIIISGGTKAGIAEVAGEIAAGNRHARAIGYLPLKTGSVSVDQRYSLRIRTQGAKFSAQEPLQYWQDILAAGIDPASVRVLGIGGGDIAALEYRIALAMGAKVIVARGSDRAVKELLEDIHWKDTTDLIIFPEEALTLRYLMKPAPRPLPETIREDIAKAIHETYRREQKNNIQSGDPAGKSWNKLPDYLKDANLGQADDIGEKLEAIGYQIKKSIAPIKKITVFSKSEVDLLARMEHGRWNAQKLLSGWKHGLVKDEARKTNPCIVKWDELSKSDQQKDIDTVKAIPEMLAEVGYAVSLFAGFKIEKV